MSALALQRIRENIRQHDNGEDAHILSLRNCGIKGILPKEIIKCDWVEMLDLRSNKELSDLKPLWALKKIRKLYCSNTMVSDLSPLSFLLDLRLLSCSRTHISDLSPLSGLFNLETLSFNQTQVSDLTPLSGLLNLEILNCSHTQVSDIEPIAKLDYLRDIDCSHTPIRDLSPFISFLEEGAKIKWRSDDFNGGIFIIGCNHLTIPPVEIAKKSTPAILQYFKQLEKQGGTETINEAKLIIVGEGKTGKTTLFKKIIDPKFDPIAHPTDETHGINIYEGLPIRHKSLGTTLLRANLWDFGGQELQYMTHQFFLTPRALYVLLMDARAESPNLSYWFKIISLLGKEEGSFEKVRVLLVLNKKKGGTGNPQYQDILEYFKDTLDATFLEVDFAENDHRWTHLKECIESELVGLPIVKNQLPKQWNPIREALRVEAKKWPHIDTRRLSEICSQYQVTEEVDQFLLTSYLHQLGSLLHFQNDPDLIDLVILRPEWAVEGVYTFLKGDGIRERNGKFTLKDIFEALRSKSYTQADTQKVLKLMSKNNFDICYSSANGSCVATQLLPENTPTAFKWHSDAGALQFRYQYPIMPKGLMSRLIVRLSDYIEIEDGQEMVWKKGAILRIKIAKNEASECRLLMKEDDAESQNGLRQIIIEVMGEQPQYRRVALSRIREEVEALHLRWFRNIKVDEMVPCCCSICRKSINPQAYKLEDLLQLQSKRNNTICFKSGDDVFISKLLEGVYDLPEIKKFSTEIGEAFEM